jgi:hypothetical protein
MKTLFPNPICSNSHLNSQHKDGAPTGHLGCVLVMKTQVNSSLCCFFASPASKIDYFKRCFTDRGTGLVGFVLLTI